MKINIKSKMPLLMTIASIAGLTATTYFASKNIPKAKEVIDGFDDETTKLEAVKRLTPVLAPVVISYSFTAASIVGSYISGNRMYKTAVAAGVAAKAAYEEYRKTNIEINGEEADQKVITEIVKEQAKENTDILPEKAWYYEPVSKTMFQATKEMIFDIERRVNMHIMEIGVASMYDVFDALTIEPPVKSIYKYGWSADDLFSGYYFEPWIAVHYFKVNDPIKGEYYEMNYSIWPYEDYCDEEAYGGSLEEILGIEV